MGRRGTGCRIQSGDKGYASDKKQTGDECQTDNGSKTGEEKTRPRASLAFYLKKLHLSPI
jgi:hypothetical protein